MVETVGLIDSTGESQNMAEMAERVVRGMAKWPDVPAVYNWLQLDRRGRWLMKGGEITHPRLLGFINQHYYAAADGSYYFQNGPQQVFVQLALTPYIYSLVGNRLVAQTEQSVSVVKKAFLSDQGDLVLQTDIGPGVIDDRHLALVEEWFHVEGDRDAALADLLSGRTNKSTQLVSAEFNINLPLQPVTEDKLEVEMGFIANPQPPDDDREYCVD